MNCPKCASITFERWDHEMREWERFCPICSWRPAYAEPKPAPEPSNRGRYVRESSAHICKCGHAKVPWRSRCRGCLDRMLKYERGKVRANKTRAVKATRKAMS